MCHPPVHRNGLAATAAVAWALSGCAGAPGPGADAPAAPGPERVVLVTIDTLRVDFVGCYGSKRARTPTLDGLAASGVRFVTAVAPTPVTLPSHASLFTGLDPPAHGVHANGTFALPESLPTLAEGFRRAGFATAAVVGAAVLDRRYGLDRGFDHYDDDLGARRNVPLSGALSERRADRVVDAALAWLETAPSRFFLWVHVYDPHANYDPPRGFRPRQAPPPLPAREAMLASVARDLPPFYAGEVYFADTEIGRLLRAVERRWPDRRTLVVATSDHGESLGAHGELTHSLSLYEATQRVPLLMRGPGLPPGRVVTSPVRLVDVAPTLLGLAGLPALQGASGRDLRPWIRGEPGEALDAYLETLVPNLDYGFSPVLGLRTATHKYLRKSRPELYDLVRDPGERHDLAAERPELVESLDAALEARLQGARPVQPRAVSAQERALLESLGYVAGSAAGSRDRPLGWVGGPDPQDRMGAVLDLMRAKSQIAAGQADAALESLEATREAGGWIAHARAHARLLRGEPELAEAHARQLIEAQPERSDGYQVLAEALEAQGRVEQASRAYQAAARHDPSQAASRLGLGRLAEAQGDAEAAAEHYRAASEVRPASVDAVALLAALHFEQGRSAQARALLERFGPLEAASPAAVARLARAEAAAGGFESARARLRAALARWRGNADLEAASQEIP